MDLVIISSVISIGGLGLLFGAGLAFASKKFAVEVDPKIEEIIEILPNANCGACGYPGCSGYAEAIVKGGGDVKIDLCAPGGADTITNIAAIMGFEAGEGKERMVAVVQCQGDNAKAPKRFQYQGIADCVAAELIMGGDKACVYGCLGLGSCVQACLFDAIAMGENGLPVVDDEKCTACGMCVTACPRGIMKIIPISQKIFIGCVSQDKAKKVKEVCSIGCTGCTLCSRPKVTPSGAIVMDGNLPNIINPYAEDLPAAVEKCPAKSFVVRQ